MIKEAAFQCKDGVVTGATAIVSLWVNERLGGGIVTVPCYAVGIVHPNLPDAEVDEVNLVNQLAAGAYFYSYRNDEDGSNIYAAVAADWVATGHPEVIRKVLEYPFSQCKVARVTLEIDEGNDRAIRNAERLGFKLEGLMRKAGKGGGDVAIYGLLPEECPIWNRKSEKVAA